ncbi:hypothetical protein CYLTODRAFT_421931 [Cylindrobasidium torrendii FP15055 ss-10]|uniref:Ubiquitin-like domain-containing protein n=1 Tax=Cylindrobasidium torrendii FP15055 ss-10 TaxID=1314674 RepID=A0A0D7BC08_9AGAR|nr:hypothetical protein CYLTODRAFT_421931 [Cylindrobasidium torrendii FP15055 ss-10]
MASTLHDRLVMRETNNALPSRPQTAVTFGTPGNSTTHLGLPRAESYARDGIYSQCASARTSFTRVDSLQDENYTPDDIESTQDFSRTPQVAITFLLISGRKRAMTFDAETTVGRVKELVWDDWTAEESAGERPVAPSSIRLLHLGKDLADNAMLKDVPFPIDGPATIVHMSIRPPGALPASVKTGTTTDDKLCGCSCIIC